MKSQEKKFYWTQALETFSKGRGVKKLKIKDGVRVLIWEVRYEALKKDITTTTKGFSRIFQKVENFL